MKNSDNNYNDDDDNYNFNRWAPPRMEVTGAGVPVTVREQTGQRPRAPS